MHRRSFLAGAAVTPLVLWTDKLRACSLVFVNDRKLAKIVVRSMDLPASFPERPKFFVFPRGMTRDGKSSVLPGIKARLDGVGSNALRWTSSCGNAAMVGFDGAATDGLNEKGLAAHVLCWRNRSMSPATSAPSCPTRFGRSTCWRISRPSKRWSMRTPRASFVWSAHGRLN